MDMATNYQLLFKNKVHYCEDRERKLRFYESRSINLDTRPHFLSFFVWQRSPSLRYLIEACFFGLVMIIF